jgi:hypothetical protein
MWFLHRKVLYTKNNLARRNQQDRKGVDFFIKMSQSNMVYYVRTSKSCLYKKSSYICHLLSKVDVQDHSISSFHGLRFEFLFF